jgi:hypothetical protein
MLDGGTKGRRTRDDGRGDDWGKTIDQRLKTGGGKMAEEKEDNNGDNK